MLKYKQMSFEHIEKIAQPHNLRRMMYPHQLASAHEMEKLEKERCVTLQHSIYIYSTLGLLADETGYGKTISMIAVILRDKMDWNMETPFVKEKIEIEGGGRIQVVKKEEMTRVKTTLVLVSPGVYPQWQEELSYTPLKYTGITNKKDIDLIEPGDYDVMLITPPLYNKFMMTHSKTAWKRFVFDEPGHVRVAGMREITAGFTWFVTATPEAIVHHHRQCRGSMMMNMIGKDYYVFSDHLNVVTIKNQREFLRSSYDMPQPQHIYHECYDKVYNAIKNFGMHNISRMIEAGNIDGAIIALGGTRTSNIFELIKQRKMEEMEEVKAKINIASIRNDLDRLEDWTEQKKRLDRQIEEIDSKFSEMLRSNCQICLEPIKDPVMEPSCQNIFCGFCLIEWLKNKLSCPLCRADIDPKDLICIKDKCEQTVIDEMEMPPARKTKQEKLLEIIEGKGPGEKVLIFSNNERSFNSISKCLEEKSQMYEQIKGTLSHQKNILERYKEKDLNILLLHCVQNGAGLNLQVTDHIILYHEMPAYVQNQIIGRANRIGRKRPVKIHHLKVVT